MDVDFEPSFLLHFMQEITNTFLKATLDRSYQLYALMLIRFRIVMFIKIFKGRAIAQAVSRRLLTAAARVQTRVWSCGIL
jgi:hypothetical protein